MDKNQKNNKIRTKKILDILLQKYKHIPPFLNFKTETEVWCAVILSAQCTDKRVNIITKKLFKRLKTFEDYASVEPEELIKFIKSSGFFNVKSKYLIDGAKIIVKKYNSKLPRSIHELVKLPGVGRKVANVILSQYFNKNEGIAVDTHVKRLSARLGLTRNNDQDKIERDLMELVDKKDWNNVSLLLIEHGRRTCKAINPKCNECILNDVCPYYSQKRNLTV